MNTPLHIYLTVCTPSQPSQAHRYAYSITRYQDSWLMIDYHIRDYLRLYFHIKFHIKTNGMFYSSANDLSTMNSQRLPFPSESIISQSLLSNNPHLSHNKDKNCMVP